MSLYNDSAHLKLTVLLPEDQDHVFLGFDDCVFPVIHPQIAFNCGLCLQSNGHELPKLLTVPLTCK
jgi:hypothetical protein